MGRNSACRLATSNTELDLGSRTAARELREIAQRHAILGDIVSADIGWTLLLWMLVLEANGGRIAVSQLFKQAGISDDTGGRWLAVMEQSGLLGFHESENKARGCVALTVSGRDKVIAALTC